MSFAAYQNHVQSIWLPVVSFMDLPLTHIFARKARVLHIIAKKRRFYDSKTFNIIAVNR